MIYAQIKDGVIINNIVLDDPTLVSTFETGYDFLIRVDQLDPMPGPDWTYDGTNFSPPMRNDDGDMSGGC